MRRARLLTGSEVAGVVLLVLAGVLALVGRQLYGAQAKAALYAQMRALPGQVDPVVLAAALVAGIVLGGFVLRRLQDASPILCGVGEIVFAGVGGAIAVIALARPVLLEPDGAVVDLAALAACAGSCAAVLFAAHGWGTLSRGCARRRQARAVAEPAEGGRPLNGLLTPASMARAAAQLALQLANYAAADANRRQADATDASARAAVLAGTATREAEAAQVDAEEWAAARLAQANAHLAVRRATRG